MCRMFLSPPVTVLRDTLALPTSTVNVTVTFSEGAVTQDGSVRAELAHSNCHKFFVLLTAKEKMFFFVHTNFFVPGAAHTQICLFPSFSDDL